MKKTKWSVPSQLSSAGLNWFIGLLVYWFIGFFLLHSAWAQSPSPTKAPTLSLTPSPSVSEDDVKETLQERLRRAADQKRDEAKKILGAELRRAVVGTIDDLSNTTISVKDRTETKKLVAVTEQTNVVRGGKSIGLKDLSIGERVIAMGYLGEGDILDARRVAAVDQPSKILERRVIVGTVTALDVKGRSLTVMADRPAELGGPETLGIAVPKKVEVDFSAVSEGTKLLVVAVPDAKDKESLTLRALKIFQ